MKEAEMVEIAGMIDQVLQAPEDEKIHAKVAGQAKELCKRFPLYGDLRQ
jgi:glycine/serine hydroxymethyltransferase